MSAIILIAMPPDHERVRNIVGALSESDLDIYWERAAPGTPEWTGALERALEARGAIFFWSAATAGNEAEPYVRLARRVLAAGRAICVRLDGGSVPEELAGCTTYDLRGWRARASSLFMLDLVAGAKAKAAGLDPPLPRAPRQLLMRRLAVAIPSAVVGLALVIGLYRDMGIDRIASPAEAAAWSTLRPSSCEDLRGFLRGHSGGVHASEAQALLSARSVSSVTRWQRAERPLTLYLPAPVDQGAGDERAARGAADARARFKAERDCRRLADAVSARFQSAAVTAHRYQCERFSFGVVCSLEGEALCRLDEPEEVEVEVCERRI